MKYSTIIIDLLIAAVVGAISSIWAEGIVDFLIGLVTFFAIEMVRLNMWARRIDEQYEFISHALKAFKSSDKFSDLVLLYGLRSLGSLSKSSISVERDHVWEFWKDCMARVNSKWSVITYAKADETWFLAWGEK